MKTSPNAPCPCGSGRKYKKCHGGAAPVVATSPLMKLLAEGERLLAAGHLTLADRCFAQAVALAPSSTAAWRGRAVLAERAGDLEAARECLARVVDLSPLDAWARFALGNVLVQQGKLAEASRELGRATELDPKLAGAWANLGNVHKYLGDFAVAWDCYRRGIDTEPDAATRARRHSNLLIALHVDDTLSADDLFEAHVEWANRYAAPLFPPAAEGIADPRPDRRLRVGYLSGSFNGQIVGHFLANVLPHHDATAYEIRAYSSTRTPDAMTDRLRGSCASWIDLSALSDEDAARRIREDAVDILVDIDGHSPTGRPLLVARKPAAVVVEWIDWFDTTGMRVVDYLLTDAFTTPPGSDQRFVEQVWRLPHARFCYAPPSDAPPVAEAPVGRRGFVTFGSFNRQDKLNPALLAVWARILAAVPEARLVLKNRALQFPEMRAHVASAFAGHGVAVERLDLRGPSAHAEMLVEYGDIDVALDSFPYNGGLTTLECLWMGVPVVALEGSRMIGRQSSALLRLLGLDDWVASRVDAYVDLAVDRARAPSALGGLRADIRRRLSASVLCDGKAFVRDLEGAFREMWKRQIRQPLSDA